jgi:tetratricopeptide (TPR) repeat protein
MLGFEDPSMSGSQPAVPTSPPAARRRRHVWAGAALAVLLVGGAAAWYFTRPDRASTSTPPEVQAEGLDPSVAEAIAKARQRVLDEPRSAAAWGDLGKLLLAHNFNPEADACFAEAERLDPEDGRWPYYRGHLAAVRDPDGGAEHFRRAVAGRHPNPVYATVARLRLAEALLARREFAEADKLFAAEAGKDASGARALYGLGLVAVARNDPDAAARHLAAAAATPFAHRKASALLAPLARQKGDTAAAAKYEQEATRPPPDRGWPDPFFAEVNKLRIGQQTELREVNELVRQGHLPEAARRLAALVRDYPNEWSYHASGEVYIRMGDYPQAQEVLRACLGLDPGNPQAHHLLAVALFLEGETHRTQGSPDRARELFRQAAEHAKQATERKPDFASAYTFRGRALVYLGEHAEAIASLRKAVECRPEVADSHLYLGEALAAAGRLDEARAELTTAEQLAGPNDPRPKAAIEKLEKKP